MTSKENKELIMKLHQRVARMNEQLTVLEASVESFKSQVTSDIKMIYERVKDKGWAG